VALGTGGATFEVATPNNLTVSGAITGVGATDGVTKTGGGSLELSAANSYAGPTTVSQGVMAISGSISGSVVTVSAPATLNVNGSITTPGAVNVQGVLSGSGTIFGSTPANANEGKISASATTSIVSPGSTTDGFLSTATLTANTFETVTGATLKIELGGTNAGTPVNGYDQVVTGHAISLASNTKLSLSLLGTYAPIGTLDKYFIIVNTGAGAAPSGPFFGTTATSYATLGGQTFNVITAGGRDFAVSYDANYDANPALATFHGGNDVALMSVPEPNSWTMLAGSLGMALGLQRFRRRRS
jgi:autotransporter-associated beta strand protein